MSQESHEHAVNRDMLSYEVVELLSGKDILKSLNSYKAETDVKELAVEFVRSYMQFVEEIVAIDNERGLLRSDVEFRDLISHVNVMLKNKDESTFNAVVFHCPNHYKAVYESLKRTTTKE